MSFSENIFSSSSRVNWAKPSSRILTTSGARPLVIDGLAALVIGVIGKLVATDEVHDAWPVAVVLGQAQNNPLLILGAEDVVQRVVDLETALRVRVAVLGGNHARSERVDASMLQSTGDVVAFAGLLAALSAARMPATKNTEHW